MKHVYATANGTVRCYDDVDALGRECWVVSLERDSTKPPAKIAVFCARHATQLFDKTCRHLRRQEGRMR